ncbi:MAG: leucine-rich repeat protein [Bacteroidales bacterium]|nr:leucine-rich repeat protein [Bacteroidales bacterium]
MSIKFLPLKRAVRTALLVLLLNVVGLTNAMAQSFTVGNLNYSVNDGGTTVTVTGHVDGTSATGSLVIPESVTYDGTAYPVTTIGDYAFDNCSGFTGSLTIGNSVTMIGNYAFYNCSGFTEVHYNATNCAINFDRPPFVGCGGTLTIANNVEVLPAGVFMRASFTGSLVIPNSVTSIGNCAFRECSGFTSLTIGNSVVSIGAQAFYWCTGFTGSLTIPNSVTSIGGSAFENCSGFTGSLTIGNSVTSIGNNAFLGCSNFTGSLTIPNSVTSISDWTFSGCSGFTGSLVIPNSVTTIGKNAFKNCSGFTGDLTIPNSVTTIGQNAFENCSGFTGSLTIGNSVTSIGGSAFYNCSGFTGSLTIPNSVTTIGDHAFYGCSGFAGGLTIPNSVTSIGGCAFEYCSGFTGSLTIGNSVTTIGERAFYDCSGFTGNLFIPNSVVSIGEAAFVGCSGFTGSLTIPDSVTSIGGSAFSGCSGFTGSLTIGNSVTSISGWTFSGCSGFTGNLTIPNSVTKIDEGAFGGCSGFTGNLTIPNSVTKIGASAFYGCSGFTGSLTIGNSVTSISDWTFSGCSGFTGNLTIPNSVTTIGDHAFEGCSGFAGDLTIGSSVTTIGDAAFQNCSGFTGSLIIGSSVTTIGSYAFCNYYYYYYNYSGFSQIYSKSTTPPTLGSLAFYGINTAVPVLVPCGTQAIYKRTSGWSAFTNYQEVPARILVTVNLELLGEASIIQYGTCTNPESTVHAEPKTDGVFSNWTVDGVVVSTEADYTFNLTEDITLVANFEVVPNHHFFVGTNSSLWSDAGNWLPQELPLEGSTVRLIADAEVDIEASVSNLYSARNTLTIKPEGNLSVTGSMQHPIGAPNDWYYYDDGIRQNIIGTGGGNFWWGVMFPAGSYEGNVITKVSAFDYNEMTGNVTIFNDGEFAPSNQVGQMDVVMTGVGDFVEYVFDAPVAIDTTKNVWVVFYNGSGAAHPAAVSADTGNPNGRWVSDDGEIWEDIAYYDLNYTFMVRAFFESQQYSITIEDGGQLFHTTDGITATVQKTITPYTSGTKDGWYLIAHPMQENVNVSAVGNLTSNEYDLYYYDEPTVYWINHEDADNDFTQMEPDRGYLYANNCSFTLSHEYGFDDGTMQGWTSIDADGDGYEWHPVSDASTSYSGAGHIGSESWKYNPGPGALFPDNYAVSPQVQFGTASSLHFWACAEDASFPAEYFGVAVSTTGNTDAADFATIQEWTMSAKSGRSTGTWYEYTVDLSQYAGQTGYVAIRHFNCSEQGALLIDDVTLSGMMEGEDAMTLSFTGELQNGTAEVNVPLVYTTGHALQGFNLVGNPFAHNVTSYASENVANGCYVMNEAKDDLVVSEISEENPLKPAEGFFVKATAEGASITFNPGRNNTNAHSGTIRVELAESDKLIDRLLVKTVVGQPLEKFSLSERRTKLFAQGEHQELAIVPCEGNEQAVNFKAAKNGQYTINVNADGMEFNYLHLIDNLTGEDVDLLVEPSYTFEASTNDYASRFLLRFIPKNDAADSSETFAFISDGNIVIIDADINSTLQIIDMTGRVVVSTEVVRDISTNGMVPGVYVLRLVNGDVVKTQKIVVE